MFFSYIRFYTKIRGKLQLFKTRPAILIFGEIRFTVGKLKIENLSIYFPWKLRIDDFI